MIARLVAFGIILFLGWMFFRSRYPIRATLTHDGVLKSKNVPDAIRSRIDEFARDNLLDGEVIKLKGHSFDRGRIRWVFPKNMNPEFAQRLRNFMGTEIYR